MANQLKMADIQAIPAILEQGWSQRRIARELGIDRETVARYARRWRDKLPIDVLRGAGSPGTIAFLSRTFSTGC
jgi:IS30 family transposase